MPWPRSARASLALLALAAAVAAPGAAGAGEGEADITLRKSFTLPPPVAAPPEPPSAPGPEPPAASPARPPAFPAAEALGESVVSGGALHLPDVAGRDLVVDTGATPLLETAGGRRLLLDSAASIPDADALAIARRWPAYRVVRPGRGARALLEAVLGEAGYASVMRATAVTFGRDATVRIEPDYLVLRRAADLLEGDTHALSVVDDPRDAIPAELREMAAAHRILVLELLEAEGRPVGPGAWRDPVGTVTTVGSAGPALVLLELADALGIAVEPGGREGTLRFALGDASATVQTLASAPAPAEAEIAAGDPRLLPVAIGRVLAALGVPAIGPSVEFSRPAEAGKARRFTISVPGWLVGHAGRRLLVTGAALPPPLRLFLAREGIDILEFRTRDGRR